MTTMNVSFPDGPRSFAEEQVADRDRQRLRRLLLDGAQSRPALTAVDAYFDGLRERARGQTAT